MPFCPNCGKEITPNAKFCRMCGKKMTPSEKTPPPAQRSIYSRSVKLGSKPEPDPRSEPEPASEPVPAKLQLEIDPISDEYLAILYSRTRIETIDSDHKKLVKEFGDVEKKMEIGLLTSEEAMNKIKDIKGRMNKIKMEKANLKTGKLQVETDYIAYKKAIGKKRKLEEMKTAGKISSESVYKKLLDEATGKIDSLKDSLTNDKITLEHWSIDLDNDIAVLNENIESMKVRAELGDITKEEARSEAEKMKSELIRKKAATSELKTIISGLSL